MKIRPWDKELDYIVLQEWWKEWRFPEVPKEILPKEGGYVVDDAEGYPVLAGFLLIPREDCPIAWLEWVVGDPRLPKGLRREAVEFLVSELKRQKPWGEIKEINFLMNFTENPRFVSTLESTGWVQVPGTYTGLLYPLS